MRYIIISKLIKKPVSILLISLFAIGAILFVLLFFARLPNSQKNGFTRHILSEGVKLLNELSLDLPLKSICGATKHNIYFTIPNPQWLIAINISFTHIDTIYVPILPSEKALALTNFQVDSPKVLFFINNEAKIISGYIKDNRVQNLIIDSTNDLFTKSVYMPPSYVVVRTFDSLQEMQVFQKIKVNNSHVISQSTVIKDQNDAGFSTDGPLLYESFNNQLIYLQYFQNRLYCLDTNLSILYTAQTIDTFGTNTSEIKQIKTDGRNKLMPSKARTFVNENAYVDNKGHLFVLSRLKADNEKLKIFNNNTVIDIYQTKNGKYKGSFYLPNFKGERPKSILFSEKLLVALHSNHVSLYSLNI